MDNTDPTLILADPQLDSVKECLYELKEVYPDKSYDELREMLETVEEEDDYERLLKKNIGQESGLFALSRSSYSEPSTTPTSITTAISTSQWAETQKFSCITKKSGSYSKSSFGNKISTASKGYIIPGLKATNVGGYICHDMVPQGICRVGNFVLISAYCYKSEHNSVIYVLNASNMQYQCTLQTSLMAHLGGIAYDGTRYLWVCNSKNDAKEMYAYDMSSLSRYVEVGRESAYKTIPISSSAIRTVGTKPSFCTYYDGILWVGKHNKTTGIDVLGYLTNGTTLIKCSEIKGPPKAQGMSFYRYNGKYYCMFTTSFDREKDSNIYVWTLENYSQEKGSGKVLSTSNQKTITMPCLMEGAFTSGFSVYSIFESGANGYKSVDTKNFCDRICEFGVKYIYK